MGKIETILTELAAGHPVQGAYSLTNSIATDQLNGEGAYTAWLRSADGGVGDMVRYLATTDNRTNEGGDTDASLLLGRLKIVAGAAPYTDPFRRAGVWEAGGSGTNDQIELDATNNKLVFGTNHTITLNAKDAIELSGSSADDGVQQIVSVTSQDVVLPSITVDETLERAFRVFKVQDSTLLTREQIQNANAILHMMLTLGAGGDSIRFDGTEISLAFADMETAGVWKSADTTALNNFSVGQHSRANELGIGRVIERDVERAREV